MPKVLGVGHLREALTDPCMNYGIVPVELYLLNVLDVLQASRLRLDFLA